MPSKNCGLFQNGGRILIHIAFSVQILIFLDPTERNSVHKSIVDFARSNFPESVQIKHGERGLF